MSGPIINGNVGVRKPDKEIFEILISSCGFKLEEILFVDDREKNVIASREVGIETIKFLPDLGFTGVKEWISQRPL